MTDRDESRPQTSQGDEAAALAALEGSNDLLRELARMFCDDAPQVVEQLEVAWGTGDAYELRRAAHSLKSLAATSYAERTVELALFIEQAATDGTLASIDA